MNVCMTAEQKKNKEKAERFFTVFIPEILPNGLNKRRKQFAKLEFDEVI